MDSKQETLCQVLREKIIKEKWSNHTLGILIMEVIQFYYYTFNCIISIIIHQLLMMLISKNKIDLVLKFEK
jgi:hypothetical protein